MRIHHLLFLVLCCGMLRAPAQTGRQYTFTHYSTAVGSVSNQVNSVVQDEDGYIWTATTEGLQRFDGVRYKVFRHKKDDPGSLPSNPVLQLMIDSRKNLWVLLANGRIGIFNTKNFTFREARTMLKDPQMAGAMKKLTQDHKGNILLLYGAWTILTWNEARNEFSEDHNPFRIPAGSKITGIAIDKKTGKYWMGLWGAGIAIYDSKTGTLSYLGNNSGREPAIEKFQNIVTTPVEMIFDVKGRLWFVTWGPGFPYAWCYDPNTNQFVVEKYHFYNALKAYYEIQGFFEQSDGTIWVRGLGVLGYYQEKEKKFQLVYNGYLNGRNIYFDAIHDMHEDREKNIWVATRNRGLYRFNPSQEFFTNISHLNLVSGNLGTGSVMAFVPTNWGTTLVSTWGDGIFEYTPDLTERPVSIAGMGVKPNNPTVWNMCLSRDSNTIWAAAQPGLYKIDQSTRTSRFYNPPILENRTMRQVAEDRKGNLWLGMQAIGLFKWNAEKGKQKFENGFEIFRKVPRVQVNKVVVDRKGLVWVATSAAGLYVIDPTTDSVVYRFNKNAEVPFRLPEDGISSVLEYNDTLMLISTSTSLHLYDRYKKELLLIGDSENIAGFIASIERDKTGYIWVSTTSGLYKVNGYLRIFMRYTRDNGIENDNFSLGSSASLPDGRLMFGSSNQFVAFNPLMVRVDSLTAGIRITDFKVMNKSLLVDSLLKLKKVRLAQTSNSLEIEFSPLNYSSDYLIRYKLEGLDKDWRVAEKNNQAVYSYLPAGNYTLLLQSIDAEGRTGAQVTQLRIKIDPPFWKSWWFYLTIIILSGGLLYWIDQERTNRKLALQKMRSEIYNNLHGEINTALSNINILSEMARLKSSRDPVKADEYIDQIHNKSHNMIIAMDDMLWSLDPQNDSMKKTVERMREYIDALNNRHGVYIDMLVDKKVEQLNLNMRLRHESFLLFKDGILNLVQAGVSICHIHLGLESPKLLFSMQFDNEAADMQQLNNFFHRQDIDKRLKDLGADLSIQVHKSSSLLLLRIPIE